MKRLNRSHLTSGLIGALAALALCAMLGFARFANPHPTSPRTAVWFVTHSDTGREAFLWRTFQLVNGNWHVECMGQGAAE